jgi:hypothetical protein
MRGEKRRVGFSIATPTRVAPLADLLTRGRYFLGMPYILGV